MQNIVNLIFFAHFNVPDFPESKAAIEDLKFCLERTNQRQQLLTSLKSAFESRLLHPGQFCFCLFVGAATEAVGNDPVFAVVCSQEFTRLTSSRFTSRPSKPSESWTRPWSSCRSPANQSASTSGESVLLNIRLGYLCGVADMFNVSPIVVLLVEQY